jgi:hypothetical protein
LSACGDGEKGAWDQVATIQAYQATQIAEQEIQIERQWDAISYLSTQMPRGWQNVDIEHPTFTPTPWTGDPTWTPTAYDSTAHPVSLVQGSVIIEEGSCCVGGTAGTEIEIEVAFDATSLAGDVTEMRVLAGGARVIQSGEIELNHWVSFSPTQSFKITLPGNWVGFYVSAQFRDTQGNISPVYWDDISVEGMPPPPTPTP